MGMDGPTITKRLAVRRCRVVSADGSETTTRSVHCPRRERSETVERCCGCSHMRTIDVEDDGDRGAVECTVPAPPTRGDRRRKTKPDVAEAAAHARLHEVMTDDVTCVRADALVEAAAALVAARGVRALPVVDETRKLVGILSKSDLLRATSEEGSASRTVSEVMTPLVHGLPEEAPIAYAISLMAAERLHEVPAVSSDGRVVGMLTALDALRWVARSLGYAVPDDPDAHRH